MLNSVLYNDLEIWEGLNYVVKMLLGLFFTSLLPLWFLIYFFAPNSHLSQLLKKPFFKFLNHGGSFVWFLALLICSSIQDQFFDVLELSPLGKQIHYILSSPFKANGSQLQNALGYRTYESKNFQSNFIITKICTTVYSQLRTKYPQSQLLPVVVCSCICR